MTLNRMCGSGLQAIVSAAQEIALGDADVVLAGGVENMDMAPFLMPKARYGYRMGMPDAKIYDHMVYDGLWDVFNDYHMGVTAENVAEQYGITREESDAYAVRSHQRAAKAHEEEQFDGQIVPVEVKQKKEKVQFTDDEHVRPTASVEGLGKLKPVFKKDEGTVTAGNASGINDGAAAMIIASEAAARAHGLTPRARTVLDELTAVYGNLETGGYAPGGVTSGHIDGSAHYEGRAIDVMLRPHDDTEVNRRGWSIAQWAVAHAQRLGIATVIYDDRIWTARRSGEGWRAYQHPSGDAENITLRHLDHVHIDVVAGDAP
jgi:hypothetical protein